MKPVLTSCTRVTLAALFLLFLLANGALARPGFVSVKADRFYLNGRPYHFVGTNYWYGSLLPLEKDPQRGIRRLRRELDFLKANGVTNLRLMAGAEGSGLMNGVTRVGPPLQLEPGKFDDTVLRGLDVVLNEMGKRGMKAVIFLSNNWEWSGGFQQYLIWNNRIRSDWLTQKPSWDELRDNVSRFYGCAECVEAYLKQVNFVVTRRNSVNGRRYVDDATIMSWELANEPRPMRPAANGPYLKWISASAASIRSLDPGHLITTGHEGWIGTQDVGLFEKAHADKNIDYITIHIWPKNWGWFKDGEMAQGFETALKESRKYVVENAEVATRLRKPMVIEEFGLPRDGQSFSPRSTTSLRDKYYAAMFSYLRPSSKPSVSGISFWAFGGTARPIADQRFWKPGDELMGDPPMEEQGLNSVFDSDRSTWNVIRGAVRRIGSQNRER